MGDFILGGNFLISNDLITQYIKFAYKVNSSRIGLTAMTIMALDSNKPIVVSNKIIDRFFDKPKRYDRNELADCWSSFSLLCLLPISYRNAIT